MATAASSASDDARKSCGTSAETGVVILKFCLPLYNWVMSPCWGDKPAEILELDWGGEFQTGDVGFCCDRRGEVDDFGGELKREVLECPVPLERRFTGTDGSLSVGEELQRLLEESLRGRRVSSRSLNVRM